ncbi:hypothetical protein BC937DRAFT_89743 [Endogone sp. FLAS-F59071]|nr:hypothetical protein BC937DRAFT_89743 [Endogone sp. FLAS-F59071]|eukprot:RUS17612.1 hypothetical protein BC937DRAFT_89743 [Endogone sp. FLAS-F59071]
MDLRAWVSDNAMKVVVCLTESFTPQLLGMSERNLVDYVIAIAQTAKTPEALFASLQATDIPATDSARQFASELFARVPRKTPSYSSSKSQRKRYEEEMLQMHKKNDSYKLLLDEPAEDGGEDRELRRARKELKKKDRKLRKKEESENAWESDQEDKDRVVRRDSERRSDDDKKRKHDESEDEYEKEERERLQDLKERDEFAQRLKEKDKEKTKKLIEDRSSKGDTDSKRRRNLADDAGARREALPEIRERSRQEYLKLREQQRLELLRLKVADEEFLFRDQRVTAKERKQHEYDKKVLELAEARLKIDDKTDGYVMPEDYITEKGKIDRKKKEAALYRRYEEDQPDKFVTDQDQWEQQQIVKASMKTGALAGKGPAPEDEYDYVFDEEQKIDFVLSATINAKDKDDKDIEMMELLDEAERKARTIDEVRKSLPIYQYRDPLLQAIEQFQVLVVVGETGSGKTTQIPQYLNEAGYTKKGQKIGCTQPRRVAAMSVAARVAEEMGVKLGYEVGYSIRFEDCTSDKTIIKYMTDGMLLREFLTEPDLAGYSCLIIDEAHDRTLHTDILFGLVKDICRFRPDLKLLISSATMNAQKFAEYFDGAPIFNIPGRPYPVEIFYTKAPEANYLWAAITQVLTIHVSQGKGDILVFLTGQDEIESAEEGLRQAINVLGSKIGELIICPIYANLPSEMQGKIFEPTPEGGRKVILATNIAETSITVDGVSFVIDPGFSKQKCYNPRTGMESLIVTPCSRASATQRAGRAGRTGPGKCFRLYTQWAFYNEMDENTIPEIQRTNLGNTVLTLKSLGINDLLNFDFMDPPPSETLIRALEQLYALGALNDKGELTKMGRRMAEFPIDPMMSKAILASEKYNCSEQIVSICAMLSVQSSLLYRPKDKKFHADKAHQNLVRPGGDHLTLLNIWDQWVETNYSIQWCFENFVQHRTMSRARDMRDQFVGLLDRVELALTSNDNPADTTPIQKVYARSLPVEYYPRD